MTQITSIKLGLIAMCIATGPLSLAQTPRIRTSGSNQIGTTTIRIPAGPSGLSGSSTGTPQLGTNFRSSMSTGPNANIAAHIGINPGAQTGINNQTGGTAPGLAGSSGNLAGATQTGTNARDATNTSTNTNAGARNAAPASVTILPQAIAVPTQTPLRNNDALSPNFSTSGQSPSPLPSASVSPTPTPTPTPAQSL